MEHVPSILTSSNTDAQAQSLCIVSLELLLDQLQQPRLGQVCNQLKEVVLAALQNAKSQEVEELLEGLRSKIFRAL